MISVGQMAVDSKFMKVVIEKINKGCNINLKIEGCKWQNICDKFKR